MLLESAFHYLFCLKFSFKLVFFLRVMQKNISGCFLLNIVYRLHYCWRLVDNNSMWHATWKSPSPMCGWVGMILRPDSCILGSGLPDPKWLFYPSGLSLCLSMIYPSGSRQAQWQTRWIKEALWSRKKPKPLYAWIGMQDTTNSATHGTRRFPGDVIPRVINNQQDVNKMSDRHWNDVNRYHQLCTVITSCTLASKFHKSIQFPVLRT